MFSRLHINLTTFQLLCGGGWKGYVCVCVCICEVRRTHRLHPLHQLRHISSHCVEGFWHFWPLCLNFVDSLMAIAYSSLIQKLLVQTSGLFYAPNSPMNPYLIRISYNNGIFKLGHWVVIFQLHDSPTLHNLVSILELF